MLLVKLSVIILVIKVLFVVAVAKFLCQLHCSQILKVPYVFWPLAFMVLFWLLLQKCFLFKKIYGKNIRTSIGFWLSDNNAELGKKLKNSKRKPNGFIKLLTIGVNQLMTLAVIFMVSIWKVTGFNLCFPDIRKPSSSTWLWLVFGKLCFCKLNWNIYLTYLISPEIGSA